MPGFYKLRQLIQELYKRIDEHGPLNSFIYKNLPPSLKFHLKQKLGVDEEGLKGLFGALHYFGIVSGNRIRIINSPDELYEYIAHNDAFMKTIDNLRNFSRKYYLKAGRGIVPNALSLSGTLLRELALKIVGKPRGLQVDRHTAITVLEIVRSFVPFIYIPGPKLVSKYPRRISQIILCLEELGGIAKLSEVYDQCIRTERLADAQEFVESLARGIILNDLFVLGRETESGKRARIALGRFLRAAGEYENVTVDRIRAFVKRIASIESALENLKKVGVSLPPKHIEEFLERFVSDLIDESIAANYEDFLAAYGSLTLEFSNMDEVIKTLLRGFL